MFMLRQVHVEFMLKIGPVWVLFKPQYFWISFLEYEEDYLFYALILFP